ncbi:flagellar basal-body rod modification protein FlgD [Methylorubrum rhodinum]|jgi:flagellar basal-body rod modification protein FlgD|uniref:Basal-body rod modification protein FlgD n=1 Tax=Methylorubrum rhodinum TaxID=29428 RepID=A0A840ZLE6_9HYPH|nr:flagellar hook capping FlgD N-terminal domain-containing protein [Methylorubrum rhodinum]MBB5757905.1 flagellar basal-body rod modification protein FlgD [Methylorubrum rhodinum]
MAAGIGSSTSITNATATTTVDTKAIAGNFTQFLTLLTTQLRNQNPLDPMDTNQFTQQLVQFAGVEQQLKTNDQLGTIMANSKASAAASTSSLIGRSVVAEGATTDLTGGKASWSLNPARAAARAIVTIKGADGSVVATKTTTLKAGSQTFDWNGAAASGLTVKDGQYTITVDAIDATGAKVAVDTKVSGKVDGVDLSGTEPVLTIGSARVPASAVKSLVASAT